MNSITIFVALDKSGSMESCKHAAIDAFNKFIDERKKDMREGDSDVFMQMMTFNEYVTEMQEEPVLVTKIPHLSVETYSPHGNTHLYGAFDKLISDTIKYKTDNPSKQVIMLFLTDGMNNCLCERNCKNTPSIATLKEKVAIAREKNIDIIYLGADENSKDNANELGLQLSGPNVEFRAFSTARDMDLLVENIGRQISDLGRGIPRQQSVGYTPGYTTSREQTDVQRSRTEPFSPFPPTTPVIAPPGFRFPRLDLNRPMLTRQNTAM